jgi:hypothetical protein
MPRLAAGRKRNRPAEPGGSEVVEGGDQLAGGMTSSAPIGRPFGE